MSSDEGGVETKIHGFLKAILNTSSSPAKPPSHSSMLRMVNLKLRRLWSRLRWPIHRRPKTPVVVHRFGRNKSRHGKPQPQPSDTKGTPIRLATFNAAMFSMAPVVPTTAAAGRSPAAELDIRCKSANDRPKSILKQQSLSKTKRRVSINLPEDEISLERSSKQLISSTKDKGIGYRIPESSENSRSVLEVLREVGADVIALQNVKAEEEKEMRPLSDLAEALGMKYVFAESWAPEYGNAILSRWPIKQWRVQKIFDDTDFRNVLKATIEVPRAGLLNFHCTHLDHLDENWRMKQIEAILRSSDAPHVLVGGLNSLDETDYSTERWRDIVKYYEEIGKPTPKVEVMKFLKRKQYVDSKDFAGECEAVVIVAKGQDVQGTCKYGTRVDYILASPNSPYKFVPGSYGVLSSKGTSDHHIVKTDVIVTNNFNETDNNGRPKQRVVKIVKASSKGIWRVDS